MVEGTFSSHFQNRIDTEFSENKESKYLNQSKKEGKVLLVGNGTFIANEYDSMMNEKTGQFMFRQNPFNNLKFNKVLAEKGIPMYYGNQDFLQNLVDYMMGETSVLDIRSKQIEIKNIDKEKLSTMADTLKIINVGLPIILILMLGFIWNYYRTKRYASTKL
jgi:hypothetical protein